MTEISFDTMMILKNSIGDAMVEWLQDVEEAGFEAEDAWENVFKVLMGMTAKWGMQGMDLDDFLANAKVAFDLFSEQEQGTLQ